MNETEQEQERDRDLRIREYWAKAYDNYNDNDDNLPYEPTAVLTGQDKQRNDAKPRFSIYDF